MIGEICILYEQKSDINIAEKVREELGKHLKSYTFECMQCLSSDRQIQAKIFDYSYYVIIIGGFLLEDENLIPKLKCNDNMKFMWTYLAGRCPEKIFVYLINPDGQAYANELKGSDVWVTGDVCVEGIAKQIADRFIDDWNKQTKLNKLDILNNWAGTKRLFSKFSSSVPIPYSEEIDLANRLLHSIEACYYNNDAKSLNNLLSRIKNPRTDALYYVKQLIELNYNLFFYSNALQTPIPNNEFKKLKNGLESIKDKVLEDKNLTLWFIWFTNIRLALLYGYTSINPLNCDFGKANDYLKSSKAALDQCKEFSKEDDAYSDLYYGYYYLNLYQIKKNDKKDDSEADTEIKEAIDFSVERFSDFRDHYISDNNDEALRDSHLVDGFNMEYYYSLTESIYYMQNVGDKKAACREIRTFLREINAKRSQQHSKMAALRKNYNKLMDVEQGDASS